MSRLSPGELQSDSAREPIAAVEKPRRSRRSKREKTSFRSAVARVETAYIDWTVGAILLVTLLVAAFLFQWERTFYPRIWLGASPGEVRYGFGLPSGTGGSADQLIWTYQLSSYSETVHFVAGRAATVACESSTSQCPGLLGLKAGAFEDDVLATFGSPQREAIANGHKILEYPEIGLSFSLSQFQVTDTQLKRREGNFLAVLGRLLVFLIP